MNEGHFVKNIPCPKCRENGNDRYILMVIAGVGVAITLSLVIWLVVDFIIKEVNVALILLGM